MILILGIIIHLILFTLLAVVIALPLAGIVCWLSRKHRKRNTILALSSPFVFIYSFYFTCLIGGFTCASIFDFTGYIRKDGARVFEWVTKIKIVGDSICGEQSFEPAGRDHYFVIDTKTDSITQYKSPLEAKEKAPMVVTGLTHLEAFYYKSWPWVIPLTILSVVVSSGLVFLLWFIVNKISK